MNVALYTRVSTSEQAEEGYSISEQIERLQNYARAKGWSVGGIYTDAGFSGATIDRPNLQKMISEIKRFDAVLVYKLDRLSRSQLDTLYLIERVFLANGVDFVSLSENFDTSSPFGKAMIGILAVFAQLEREQIKERMQMGKEARAKEGKWIGSWSVPVGYDYVDGNLVVNEFEKIQVQEVFQSFIQGTSIKKIITQMSDKGFQHKYGQWNDRTIRNVMRSKVYLGFIRYRDQWYQGTHEPIVSQEEFEKAQVMLDEQKTRYDSNLRDGAVRSYLGGLLRCKQCGSTFGKMTAYNRDHSKRCYYYCNSRMRRSPHMITDPSCRNRGWKMETLDQIIFDEIRKLAVDPDFEIVTESPDFTPIEDEIKRLDSNMSKLLDLYVGGNIPVGLLQEKIHSLQDQRTKLEHELDKQKKTEHHSVSRNDAHELAVGFSSILDSGDFFKIRKAIEALICYIELDGDDIDIHWNFS